MNILYVEDTASFRELANIVLRTQLHHDVYFAYDGKMALEMLKENPAMDLIITDVSMPTMDGNTLVQELEKNGIKIPVAVITGDPDTAKIKSNNLVGVFDKTAIVNFKNLFSEIIASAGGLCPKTTRP
jgi:adenylate cyclase